MARERKQQEPPERPPVPEGEWENPPEPGRWERDPETGELTRLEEDDG